MIAFGDSRQAILQLQLEQAWADTLARSARAAKIHLAAAVFFVVGFVKFAYLVPIHNAPIYELLIWLFSACLLPPSAIYFASALWREWHAYKVIVAFSGHAGTKGNPKLIARFELIREFIRLGRA